MNVMEIHDDGFPPTKISYFIDCPVDIEMFPAETRRIEIPRELGIYIKRLQHENADLKNQLQELQRSKRWWRRR